MMLHRFCIFGLLLKLLLGWASGSVLRRVGTVGETISLSCEINQDELNSGSVIQGEHQVEVYWEWQYAFEGEVFLVSSFWTNGVWYAASPLLERLKFSWPWIQMNTLSISQLGEKDSGKYRCTYNYTTSRGLKQLYVTTILTVVQPPVLKLTSTIAIVVSLVAVATVVVCIVCCVRRKKSRRNRDTAVRSDTALSRSGRSAVPDVAYENTGHVTQQENFDHNPNTNPNPNLGSQHSRDPSTLSGESNIYTDLMYEDKSQYNSLHRT